MTHTPEEMTAQLQKLAEDFRQLDPEVVADAIRKGKQGISLAGKSELETEEELEFVEEDKRRINNDGFWAEGEESMGADEDYYGDDITSDGHAQLQMHRYLREYARLIAWELPLLSRELSPSPSPSPRQHLFV